MTVGKNIKCGRREVAIYLFGKKIIFSKMGVGKKIKLNGTIYTPAQNREILTPVYD